MGYLTPQYFRFRNSTHHKHHKPQVLAKVICKYIGSELSVDQRLDIWYIYEFLSIFFMKRFWTLAKTFYLSHYGRH